MYINANELESKIPNSFNTWKNQVEIFQIFNAWSYQKVIDFRFQTLESEDIFTFSQNVLDCMQMYYL